MKTKTTMAKVSLLESRMAAQICSARLTGAEPEFRFHPVRRWRFDFAFPASMVALECEGGTFSGGRHTRGAGYEADAEKYSEAAVLGWIVIRATGNMIADGRALDLLRRALAAREVSA